MIEVTNEEDIERVEHALKEKLPENVKIQRKSSKKKLNPTLMCKVFDDTVERTKEIILEEIIKITGDSPVYLVCTELGKNVLVKVEVKRNHFAKL